MNRTTTTLLALLALASAHPAFGQGASIAVPFNQMYAQPPGPNPFPAAQLPALAQQLVIEARQLLPTVRYELAGTNQGRRVEVATNALTAAVEAFESMVRGRSFDPLRSRQAYQTVARASGQLQGELNNPPNSAPQSNWIAGRVDRLVYEVGRIIEGELPGPGPAPRPDYDLAQLQRLCDLLEADLGALRDRIWREVGSSYPYDQIGRELDGLLARTQQFHGQVGLAQPLGTLQATWMPLREQARMVEMGLATVRPPRGVDEAWRTVRGDLDRITTTLGLSPDYTVQPDRPVIINPPAFPNLPYPITPDWASRPNPSPVLGLVDQAIGEVDGFLLGIQPNLLVIPEGPRFQADAREVRGSLMRLRQATLGPPGNRVAAEALRRVEADYARLRNRTDRIARGKYGTNIARVLRLGDLITAMRGQVAAY